eukprot:9503980-Pyramimonas_sp.AAC.3
MAQVSSFPIAQVCWSTSSVASYAHSSLNDCGGVPNNVTTSLLVHFVVSYWQFLTENYTPA